MGPCRSQWLADASSRRAVPGHLETIADRVWVVQQCLAQTAEEHATQQGLLQYGLQVTAEHCHPTDLTACVEGEAVSLQQPHLLATCLGQPTLGTGCVLITRMPINYCRQLWKLWRSVRATPTPGRVEYGGA